MKSGKITIGNREIKPAKRIEKTHAVESKKKEKEKTTTKVKRKTRISKIKNEDKLSEVLTFRVSEKEMNDIKKYLEKEGKSFSNAIREILKKEGVI